MKNLNIYELHEEINKKKNKRNQSFEHVLETCHRKIKTASTKELVKVFFDVPEFVDENLDDNESLVDVKETKYELK